MKNGQANTAGVPTVEPKRVAIYTRKSTDKGLERDFNSLDAQREASRCANRPDGSRY